VPERIARAGSGSSAFGARLKDPPPPPPAGTLTARTRPSSSSVAVAAAERDRQAAHLAQQRWAAESLACIRFRRPSNGSRQLVCARRALFPPKIKPGCGTMAFGVFPPGRQHGSSACCRLAVTGWSGPGPSGCLDARRWPVVQADRPLVSGTDPGRESGWIQEQKAPSSQAIEGEFRRSQPAGPIAQGTAPESGAWRAFRQHPLLHFTPRAGRKWWRWRR